MRGHQAALIKERLASDDICQLLHLFEAEPSLEHPPATISLDLFWSVFLVSFCVFIFFGGVCHSNQESNGFMSQSYWLNPVDCQNQVKNCSKKEEFHMTVPLLNVVMKRTTTVHPCSVRQRFTASMRCHWNVFIDYSWPAVSKMCIVSCLSALRAQVSRGGD